MSRPAGKGGLVGWLVKRGRAGGAAGGRRGQDSAGGGRRGVASVGAAQVDQVAEVNAAVEPGFGGDGTDEWDELLWNSAVALSEFHGPGEGVC